ncbi:MAG: YicC family protein [Deltaproteobacteria bacterium]|nr:YicC family protein [Deltaproteobacteria bacterium]
MSTSMTGFGQAEDVGFHVEIKGVNHRYREIRVKLPRDLSQMEMLIRENIHKAISRGKIDITISRIMRGPDQAYIAVNWDLAQAAFETLQQMAQRYGGEVGFKDIIEIPGVLAEDVKDLEEQWSLLQPIVAAAIESFCEAKQTEGSRLEEDILSRIESLLEMMKTMQERADALPQTYRDRLEANLETLLADKAGMIDELRLAQEVVIMADKSDITEELVRLKSHLETFEKVIHESKSAVGRRLEFMLQEIHREINTIGSKSQDTTLSHLVIDAKTEVEKIREQIQNIE